MEAQSVDLLIMMVIGSYAFTAGAYVFCWKIARNLRTDLTEMMAGEKRGIAHLAAESRADLKLLVSENKLDVMEIINANRSDIRAAMEKVEARLEKLPERLTGLERDMAHVFKAVETNQEAIKDLIVSREKRGI
jgi:hypothetical protein